VANSVSAFWQTLVAAATEASQLLAPNWRAIESIYMDYSPIPATIGQTLDIAIPGDPTSSVSDIGVGDAILTDFAFTNVPMTFNNHPEYGVIIRDFEQYNSPDSIRTRITDPALKGVKSYINKQVCALFTTGNFAINPAIATTGHIITTTQALAGYAVLSDKFVPVQDNPQDMSLMTGSIPYAMFLGDANWTSAQIAGYRTTDVVRETGVMPVAYGFQLKLDQQCPVSGTAPSRTFTGALFHKWAVAMATRPIATPETTVVEVTTVDFAGVPLRVMLSYNHLKLGWIVTIDAGYALKVVRPEMCQLYTIAE
jgi:hypothetical protein